MKKLLMIFLLFIAIAGVAATGLITYSYNRFTPQRVDIPAVASDLIYFQESWEDCRKAFTALSHSLKNRYNDVQTGFIAQNDKSAPELGADFCFIPAQGRPEKLLILTSGIHGIEGFVGSAVQQMMMAEILEKSDLTEMGVLLIHGINAHGFKHKRRVSQNNIDLNRNCSEDTRLYHSQNQGYAALNTLLNPEEEVRLSGFKNRFFFFRALSEILQKGTQTLKQAVLQGQYEFEKGIYFGGRNLDTPIQAITPLLREVSAPYPSVLCIDLHTGYGERGRLHLFPNPMEEGVRKTQMRQIFKGFEIDWGDKEDFYTVTGDFTSYVGRLLGQKHYLPMAFEFGTLDSQRLFGLITSLQRVILENQGHHFGYASPEEEAKIKAMSLEGYFPSSRAWRTKAIQDARALLLQTVPAYASLISADPG